MSFDQSFERKFLVLTCPNQFAASRTSPGTVFASQPLGPLLNLSGLLGLFPTFSRLGLFGPLLASGPLAGLFWAGASSGPFVGFWASF